MNNFAKISLHLAFVLLLITSLSVEAGAFEEEVRIVASDLLTSLGDHGPMRVAVLDFYDVRGYQSALDAYLAEEFTTALALAGTQEITLIERRQLRRVLDEQQLTSSEVFDEQSLNRVGQLLGVDALVSGSLTILKAEVKVHVRAVSVSSGAILAAARMSLDREQMEPLLQQPLDGSTPGPSKFSRGMDTAQHPNAFFQNRYLRLTVASVGRSKSGKQLTIALTMENLTGGNLYFAAPISNSLRCYIQIADNRGNATDLSHRDVGGLPCTGADETEDFGLLSPGSQTTVVLAFGSSEPFGEVFSLGMELFISQGDGKSQPVRVMAGISGIRLPLQTDPAGQG